MNREEIEKIQYSADLQEMNQRLGFWYRCLKHLGESTTMRFGQKEESGHWTWSIYDHENYDGLAALSDYLKTQFNYDLDVPKLRADWKAPSFFKKFIGAWKYQTTRELPPIEWKERDFSGDLSSSNPNKETVTMEFSPEESDNFLLALKGKKHNFNAWCMRKFSDFLKENFLTENVKHCLWQFPVNMRGHVDKIPGEENQSSYVDVVVYDDYDPAKIRDEMIRKFEAKEHWYVYYGAKLIPKVGGEKAFGAVKDHILNGGPPYIGNFSNLGSFNVEGCEGPVYLATPATRVRPIGFGTLTVNGWLTFTLAFHETLPIPKNFQENWSKFRESLTDV